MIEAQWCEKADSAKHWPTGASPLTLAAGPVATFWRNYSVRSDSVTSHFTATPDHQS
jgi:hypothetical protein